MNDVVVKKNKSGGILVGIIFILAGIFLLWFNEGRTVKTKAAIMEAEGEYIDVSSETIDKNNEGKLIATNGKLEVSYDGATDTTFDIHVAKPKLKRTVEMYQWKETCEDNNGNEVCRYSMVWDDEIINSNAFEDATHNNPSSMPYSSESFTADGSKIGDFILDGELLNQLNADKKINLQDSAKITNMGLTNDGTYYTNVQNGTPKVGDIRISFSYSDATNVSVLAVQNNNGFSKFTSKEGYSIYELEEGTLTGKQILQKLSDENNMTKWIFRLMGTIFIIGGFAAIISPLQRLANFIPFFGTVFGWVTGFATFILGLALSLIVIALAWLRYRPVLSIGLLIGVLIVIILTKKLKTKNNTNKKEINTQPVNIQNTSVNITNTQPQTPIQPTNNTNELNQNNINSNNTK